MARRLTETFEDGPGGWMRWGDEFTLNEIQGGGSFRPLENSSCADSDDDSEGAFVTTRSPWWIDYNHAPPTADGVGTGAGYMHMLFVYLTKGPIKELDSEMGGGTQSEHTNRLVRDGFPSDFTDVRLSLRLRGELDLRGAQVFFQIWGDVDGISSGYTLISQPINVTKDWSTQTIVCNPDPTQWLSMGGRHDRSAPRQPFPQTYGNQGLQQTLKSCEDVMLVLFPINVQPMGNVDGDPNELRPQVDYPVWRHKLPEGYVSLAKVEIEWPAPAKL